MSMNLYASINGFPLSLPRIGTDESFRIKGSPNPREALIGYLEALEPRWEFNKEALNALPPDAQEKVRKELLFSSEIDESKINRKCGAEIFTRANPFQQSIDILKDVSDEEFQCWVY